jgi:hypothetical protein
MSYLPDLNTKRQTPTDEPALSVRTVHSAAGTSAFGVPISNQEFVSTELLFSYGILGETVNTSYGNGGYISASGGMAYVTAGSSVNGYATLEGKEALHYVSGFGGRLKFAGYFVSGGMDNSYQEVGIGDSIDGYFFGYSGSQFGVLRRSDGNDNWITQQSWSLDQMDGTGPSQQILNPTLGNVYSVSYQWLGFGAITYLVEDAATGMLCPVHRINYANANVDTSIRNATLPLHIGVRSVGSTGSVAVRVSSIAGMIEGTPPIHGLRRGDQDTASSVTLEVPLISIMNTGSFNGRINRMRIKVDSVSIASRDTTGITQYRLVQNATLTNSVWTSVSASNSPVSVDKSATNISGGRQILFMGLGPNGTQLADISHLNVKLSPGETLTLTCSGSNSTCLGGFSWVEET